MSPSEPPAKRTVAFIDGQNLYFAAKEAFGYPYPNYDVAALSQEICKARGWRLDRVLFYTGIPEPSDDPLWHQFWVGKLASMGKRGVHIFSRPLRYRNVSMKLPDGRIHSHLVGQEKGVDMVSPTARNRRGINKTDWIKIERSVYDTCIDPTDYRPRKPGGGER